MITHDGLKIPTDPAPWDPDGIGWISMAWDDAVACSGAMLTSTWILPDGWTGIQERTNVPIQDCDGTQFAHANQVNLSTTNLSGTYTFTNRVTFAGDFSLDRSVKIKVKPL